MNSDTFVNAVYPQTVGPDLVVACTVCMKGYLLEPDFVNHAYKCVWTPATCPHSTIAKAGFCGACPDGCPDCEFGAVGTITHKVKCTTCDTLHYDM